jgi:hypothetical protein
MPRLSGTRLRNRTRRRKRLAARRRGRLLRGAGRKYGSHVRKSAPGRRCDAPAARQRATRGQNRVRRGTARLVGVWALGGFYLSRGPLLAAQLLGSENLLWGGVLIFLLTGLGAAASTALRKTDPSSVMLGGSLALIAGASVTFAANAATGIPAVIAGLATSPQHLPTAPAPSRAPL